MATLYRPFRNELVDILDQNKFLDIYDAEETEIVEARKEFESDIDIYTLMAEIEAMCVLEDERTLAQREEPSVRVARADDPLAANEDDFEAINTTAGISALSRRSNVMSSEEWCRLMRLANNEQRQSAATTPIQFRSSSLAPLAPAKRSH
jgi:hypothetical protein